jgi:hypothetical protein
MQGIAAAAFGVDLLPGTCAETEPLLMMRPPRRARRFIMPTARPTESPGTLSEFVVRNIL